MISIIFATLVIVAFFIGRVHGVAQTSVVISRAAFETFKSDKEAFIQFSAEVCSHMSAVDQVVFVTIFEKQLNTLDIKSFK